MKAMIMSAVGGPEVLRLAEVPRPVAGPNEVLVRVKAAGVNPIDYKLRKTGAMKAGPGTILGFDAAGIVEEVGPGVGEFEPGERVFYSPVFTSAGAYAEFQVAPSRLIAPMPAGLTFEQAAALPLAGTTAWDALLNRGGLRLGQSVLIAGANGGVGTLALQLAKAAGAWVFATCSTRSMDFVGSIPVAGSGDHRTGPDRLLNYQKDNWPEMIKAQCPEGLDLVLDCVGEEIVSRSIGIVRPFGRIVTIVNPSGKLDEAYRRNLSIHYAFLDRSREALEFLKKAVERGQLTPLVDSVFPLDGAAEAHRRLEAGGVKGKIILAI